MTKEFKTKNEIIKHPMPKILGNNQYSGKTIVGLDGGYSSVKCISGNRACMFSSYAKKVNKDVQIISALHENDILLRDNTTDTLWAIGSLAENLMDRKDIAQTTDENQYTRYRYNSPAFKAAMTAGLGIGLLDSAKDNEIHVQTGLPSEYAKTDAAELIDALAGEYDFSIKIGNDNYRSFRFTLDKKNIGVMEQPQGTLFATAYDRNGKLLPNGGEIMSSNTIIYDCGFGTEDIFAIRSGMCDSHETHTDTTMRAVFEETIRELEKEYGVSYKVFEFQKFLESGKASFFDRKTFSAKTADFEEILREKNRMLCEKSILRLMENHDNLLDFQNLVITGGTGESRFEQIKKMLSGIEGLNIIPGNANDPGLPFAYLNAVGYYMYKYLTLMREMRTA